MWEGRAGSLAGPVVADATGGNQGFAQLVCLIGNFVDQPPTVAAQDSLARLLLFLADRYDVDTDPAATVTFTSRGSNKYRAGRRGHHVDHLRPPRHQRHRLPGRPGVRAPAVVAGTRQRHPAASHPHRPLRHRHPPRLSPRLTAPRPTAPRLTAPGVGYFLSSGIWSTHALHEIPDSTKYPTTRAQRARDGWEGPAVACGP